MHKRRPVVISLLLPLLLAACASAPVAPPPGPPLVWPAAPDAPRVQFVRTIVRAEDLDIRKGLMQRLSEVLFGANDQRLVRPMAVADAGGVLYVADPGVRGVHRFDRQAGHYEIVRRADGLALPSPVGLALGGGGEVYVADSSLRKVFVLAHGASAVTELPLQAELRQPTGLAFDSATGRLFVADTAAHQVLVFERDGRLATRLGRRGEGAGEFNFPTLLWRDAAGLLYVTDALNFRVQVFDAAGRFVSQFGRLGNGSGDLARHKGVATDSRGHIYVVDGLLHALQIFDSRGRLLLGLGAQGSEPGEFWLPAGIFITADDTIYVADAYNRRVQVFRYIGGAT
ncbi:MAG: 6-bladed beta-propeller [Rubrivivax sp.]|nr:6-bladed beta-propeller [Rubrivivax sp.]